MRLTFICKRFPQQRDLLSRPYGRFHFLPAELARLGHEVQVLLVSHHGLDKENEEVSGIRIISRDLRRMGPLRFFQDAVSEVSSFKPDWVIGLSDAQFGWLAQLIARRVDARLAVDAYDNYEAYMPWNFPLHSLWRRAIGHADLVTAAGPHLASLLQRHRPDRDSVEIVPMAADPAFLPMDRVACRIALGLPPARPLVGYFGGWGRSRGTDVLLDAFRLLRHRIPDVQLVLSGSPPADVLVESGAIGLGYLPDNEVPRLVNAVDVSCVISADTAFGRYSYPSKLCEAMSCGTAVVASATDPISWMLRHDSLHLAPLADADSLAARIEQCLDLGRVNYPASHSWAQCGEIMNELLLSRS